MMANILIAIGFFFSGVFAGTLVCASVLNKLSKTEKEDLKNKHIVVYEF